KKAINLEKGSAQPNRNKVGKISRAKLMEIAKIKLPDLNTKDIKSATSMMEGTAKSLGLDIID
ncbi:MAG TPA: 50S ribosomal protein L11, partial [bacterium]|nr:50S ribosomal protein L11 [bacterium]